MASPLGKRKELVGWISSEQCLQGTGSGEVSVSSPGTATSATGDLTHCGSLSPGLCRSLVKESYSSPPKSESCSPVGAQGEGHQTEDTHLQSYRSNKTRDKNRQEGIIWKSREAGNICVY